MRNFVQYIDSSYRLKVQECSFDDGHYRVSNIPDNFFVVSLFVNSKKVRGVYLRYNENLFCESIINDLSAIDLNVIPENVFFAPLQVVDLMYSAVNDTLNCVCTCNCNCGSTGGGVDAPTLELGILAVDYTVLSVLARGTVSNQLDVQVSSQSDFASLRQFLVIDKTALQFDYDGWGETDAYVRLYDRGNNIYSNVIHVPAFVAVSLAFQNLNNEFNSFDFQYLGSTRSPMLKVQTFHNAVWYDQFEIDSTTGHFDSVIVPSLTNQKVRLYDPLNGFYSNELVMFVPAYSDLNFSVGSSGYNPVQLSFNLSDALRAILPLDLSVIPVQADYYNYTLDQHTIENYLLSEQPHQQGVLSSGQTTLKCSFMYDGVTYRSGELSYYR